MSYKHKKSLGQNFLHDTAVLEEIITISGATAEQKIIEVGPGDGALTQALADTGAAVLAVEIDEDLLAPLERRFADTENVEVLHGDIRRIHIAEAVATRGWERYRVVANVPYYITASIVRLFLESTQQPESMTLMVQKEVAERICARPGEMSILAVAVQYYGVPTYALTVPAEAFDPVPQVDSAVIHIADIARTATPAEEKAFFRTVRAGFSARRKMLAKNLASSLQRDKKDIEHLLSVCSIAPTARAQELTVEQWRALAKVL